MANPALEKEFGGLPEVSPSEDPHHPPAGARAETMTVAGTAGKTGALLLVALVAGAWGWSLVDAGTGPLAPPWWWYALVLGVLVLAVVTVFRPALAPVAGPPYAATQGVALGAIGHLYDRSFDGVLAEALLVTAAVFVVMLVLFVGGAVRVTRRFQGVVVGATLGIALYYLVAFLVTLFGGSVPAAPPGSATGIVVSLVVVGVAALNLMLDFDMIARGVVAGVPRELEWYGAFGLMVTIVWMYVEILRLVVRSRNR